MLSHLVQQAVNNFELRSVFQFQGPWQGNAVMIALAMQTGLELKTQGSLKTLINAVIFNDKFLARKKHIGFDGL